MNVWNLDFDMNKSLDHIFYEWKITPGVYIFITIGYLKTQVFQAFLTLEIMKRGKLLVKSTQWPDCRQRELLEITEILISSLDDIFRFEKSLVFYCFKGQ